MSNTDRIVSLWELLKRFDNADVMGALTHAASMKKVFDYGAGKLATLPLDHYIVIEIDALKALVDNCAALRDAAEMHGLPGVRKAADNVVLNIGKIDSGKATLNNCERITSSLESLFAVFVGVIEDRYAFMLSYGSEGYLDNAKVVDNVVSKSFPNSVYDLEEAAKCLAFERWTACVMHSMRSLDNAINIFQASLNVQNPKENWKQILDQIEASIKALGNKHPQHQWNSEASSYFRVMKDAWRNHAMHGKDRYDEARAKDIYDATRGFLRHLSSQLFE